MSDSRALLGARRMHKSFQPLCGDWDGTAYVNRIRSADWIEFSPTIKYIETYFDTSAYQNDSLTIMPMAVNMQEAGRYQFTNPGNQRMLVLNIVTVERITDIGLFTSLFINHNTMVGFPNSDIDFTQVIYGRFREFIPVSQGSTVGDVLAPASDQQFGSLEPTTASKLWTYCIVYNIGLPDPPTFGTMRYPSSRIIIDIDVVKEDDIPFLMRQKRSYELAN